MPAERQPYFGVSGIGSKQDHHVIMQAAPEIVAGTGRFVRVSVLANSQTQLADRPSEHGSSWYSVGEAIRDVALRDSSLQTRAFVHCDHDLLLQGRQRLLQ